MAGRGSCLLGWERGVPVGCTYMLTQMLQGTWAGPCSASVPHALLRTPTPSGQVVALYRELQQGVSADAIVWRTAAAPKARPGGAKLVGRLPPPRAPFVRSLSKTAGPARPAASTATRVRWRHVVQNFASRKAAFHSTPGPLWVAIPAHEKRSFGFPSLRQELGPYWQLAH